MRSSQQAAFAVLGPYGTGGMYQAAVKRCMGDACLRPLRMCSS